MNAAKTKAFFSKALDTMFKVVGFDGYDPAFAQQEGWYGRREWSREQREGFRKWFVANARKDLKWSEKLAEREFGLFDLMWGWREAEEKGETRP